MRWVGLIESDWAKVTQLAFMHKMGVETPSILNCRLAPYPLHQAGFPAQMYVI